MHKTSRPMSFGWADRSNGDRPGSSEDRTPDLSDVSLGRRTDQAYGAQEPLMTVKSAAIRIGCCEETIRRAYLAQQLQVERLGDRNIRIRPDELQAWLVRGGKTTAA